MKRRRRGTGTINPIRHEDGSVTFRPRLPAAGPRLSICASYEEAEGLLDAALVEIAERRLAPSSAKTLRVFGATFLDDREAAKVTSIDTDRSRWKQHIEPAYFADWPLGDVKSHDVREWLAGLMRKNASPGHGHKTQKKRRLSRSTVQNTLNLLRSCFTAALEAAHIRENPVADVSLPRGAGVTHEPWTYLDMREQQALLRCEKIPEPARLLIAFAIGTGMRQGEVWNLELRDVDLKAGRITVRYGSKGGATKGRRIRRVPLFGMARIALDRWLELLPSQKNNPHKLVWPLSSGERRQKGEPAEWSKWLTSAKLTPENRHDGRAVRWHDLRHTCGSSLVAGWWGRRWTLIEVRDMLGHRSVTTTERYAHLAASALDEAARDTEQVRGRWIDRSDQNKTTPSDPDLASSENHGSRLGDLNSRPTVYETGPKSLELREVELLRGLMMDSSRLAMQALEAIQRDRATGWAVAVRALGGIVRISAEAAAAAAPPAARSA